MLMISTLLGSFFIDVVLGKIHMGMKLRIGKIYSIFYCYSKEMFLFNKGIHSYPADRFN